MDDTCPVCGIQIEEESNICLACGSNIKVHQFDSLEIIKSRLSNSPAQNYRVYTLQLETMDELETIIEVQKEYIRVLGMAIEAIIWDLNATRYELEVAKKRHLSVNSISLRGLQARIMGNRKEKSKRYRKEISNKKEELVLVKVQKYILEYYLQIAKSDLAELERILQDREQLFKNREEILGDIQENVLVPGEDKLRERISELRQELDPLHEKIRRLHMISRLFVDAVDDLENAIDGLENPESLALNSIHYPKDVSREIKNRRVSSAKLFAITGRRKLIVAISFGRSLGSIKVPIPSAGTVVLDTFFDNIIRYGSDSDRLVLDAEKLREKIDLLERKANYLKAILKNMFPRYYQLKNKISQNLQKINNNQMQLIESQLS